MDIRWEFSVQTRTAISSWIRLSYVFWHVMRITPDNATLYYITTIDSISIRKCVNKQPLFSWISGPNFHNPKILPIFSFLGFHPLITMNVFPRKPFRVLRKFSIQEKRCAIPCYRVFSSYSQPINPERGWTCSFVLQKGNTALHIASLAGQESIVIILVEHGANVNVQSQVRTDIYLRRHIGIHSGGECANGVGNSAEGHILFW